MTLRQSDLLQPLQRTAAGSVSLQKEINVESIKWESVELSNVWPWDYPELTDAYISYAEWDSGRPLSEEELENLNEARGDIVNQLAREQCFEERGDDMDQWTRTGVAAKQRKKI